MTVPAKRFVATTGSVLPVAGAGLVLNGMFLTTSTRVPIGTVLAFADAISVGNFFGAGSSEAIEAAVYFAGWDGSIEKPGTILFAQYPNTAGGVSAYIRGGNISAIPLATLQGYNGTLAIVVDATARSGSINLSGATSFSNAASLIQTALNTGLSTIVSFTGVLANTGILTTSAVTGTLAPGQTVVGAGVTGSPYIVSQLTGTAGGAGTYQLSGTGITVGSEAMTTQATPVVVTYDSQSGAFIITSGATGALASAIAYPTTSAIATNLLLTAATGAVLSQGANQATPAAFMNTLVQVTQNWFSFTTMFNPDVSGFANKLAFAAWVPSLGVRYCYVPWDLDPNAASQQPGTFAGFGAALQAAGYSGTAPVWEPSNQHLAAFLMGMMASVDFEQTGGRVSFAAKSQSGLTPGVTDDQSFLNLAGDPQTISSFGNGYNVYAAIATATTNFQWFQRSTMPGVWKWVDAYMNAAWIDAAGQSALMNAFGTINAIAFNPTGANTLKVVLQPVIQQALLFGMMSPGVTLTGAQISAVNASAGKDIATTIANVGYYLLIQPASPAVRANRGPWQIVLYYADAGAVQSVNFATIAIQ